MATDPKTVAYIVDQVAAAGDVAAKPMFGEYGVYCQGRMVALICDDRLFVKPTTSGRALAPDAAEAAPYPGAKPCLVIGPERWDERDWMVSLFSASAAELPPPKPKKTRAA